MKYLVCVLVLLFTSPAFAYDDSSAFKGAHAIDVEPVLEQESPVVEQDGPVAEEEAEFKIDERLYSESVGSNTGYYGGGYYGEERYASQIAYYTITTGSTDFGINAGFFVVNDQLIPFNSTSPFFGALPIFSSGFRSGIGVNVGNFTFFRGGGVGVNVGGFTFFNR